MPIYEFYCAPCHTVFSFLSKRVNTDGAPACPKCGSLTTRRPSTFAMSRNLKEAPAPAGGDGGGGDPFAGMDEGALESAMESLASEADGIDENDPRQAANVMRRLFDATGMPMGGSIEEALKRMESGEDPEKIEEDMGDLLEEDPFAAAPAKAAKGGRPAPRPARVDPDLYEM